MKNQQKTYTSLLLPFLSTFNEKELKPYWNSKCNEIQSNLWIPHKKDGLNYTEVQLSYWIKQLIPMKNSIQRSLLVSLPPFVIPITENVQQIATKKIRIYPDNIRNYEEAMYLERRAYNLAIDMYNKGLYKDSNNKPIDIRKPIKEIIKQEIESSKFLSVYSANLVYESIRKAGINFATICKRNKKNKSNESLKFKSRRGTKHTFSIDKFPVGKNPYNRALGKIHISEDIPSEAIGKSASVTCDKGRYFLNVQQLINLKSEIQGKVKCIAIDPGVRTFATCYSEDEVLIVGDNLAKDALAPIAKKVDNLISRKTRILNQFKDDKPKHIKEILVYIDRTINKLKCKKEDIISDLHRKLAHKLVTNYDVIFLPTFETRSMVSRKNGKRTLRRNTCRQLLDLSHYKFKMHLKWMAKKYGKHLVEVNESYTSKTRSWDGTIDYKLGSKKIIKDSEYIVDRDVNAARGILLKHLTR